MSTPELHLHWALGIGATLSLALMAVGLASCRSEVLLGSDTSSAPQRNSARGTDAEDVDDGIDDLEDGDTDEEELLARMASAELQIAVAYEREPENVELEIIISGGRPNAVLPISVNDTVLLTITLDARGSGSFEFNSLPQEPAELLLPSGFPSLVAGDRIAVGGLEGTLEHKRVGSARGRS